MTNPYSSQPKRAFWRSGVSDHSALEIPEVFRPRFKIDQEMRISCAGSCFAQHIGAQFKKRGYRFVDMEVPPPMLASKWWQDFGFDLYSARYGNIYTIRQLMQMLMRANGSLRPVETAWVDKNGRARDPFRPAFEPDGFLDVEALERDRDYYF